MTFCPDTVVADAIKRDPAVIDRLVAFDPKFRKLRNPVLRRVMARLVRFRDAARVAGVPLDALMAAVNGGDMPAPAPEGGTAEEEPRPDWLASVDEGLARRLDVRPMLAANEEPLGAILHQAAKVSAGGVFLLEAPFDPMPVRRVLGRKGFVSHARPLGPDHWRVVFLRDPSRAAEQWTDEATAVDGDASVWTEVDGVHIDVRGLSPPQPMLAIVALLERLGDGSGPVVVHHEREPVFLYPELAERGWRHEIVAAPAGEVRLLLFREDRP